MNIDRSQAEAALLAALAECWPNPAAFDATAIANWLSVHHVQSPLNQALGFLRLRVPVRTWYLNESSKKRLDKWLWKIDGRERGGMILQRDCYGWCRVSVEGIIDR